VKRVYNTIDITRGGSLLWIEEGAGVHEVVDGVGEGGKASRSESSRLHPGSESQQSS